MIGVDQGDINRRGCRLHGFDPGAVHGCTIGKTKLLGMGHPLGLAARKNRNERTTEGIPESVVCWVAREDAIKPSSVRWRAQRLDMEIEKGDGNDVAWQ